MLGMLVERGDQVRLQNLCSFIHDKHLRLGLVEKGLELCSPCCRRSNDMALVQDLLVELILIHVDDFVALLDLWDHFLNIFKFELNEVLVEPNSF